MREGRISQANDISLPLGMLCKDKTSLFIAAPIDLVIFEIYKRGRKRAKTVTSIQNINTENRKKCKIYTSISKLVRMTCYCDNLHQICLQSKNLMVSNIYKLAKM